MAFLSSRKHSSKQSQGCFIFQFCFSRDSDVHVTKSFWESSRLPQSSHNLKHHKIMGFKLCMGRKVEDCNEVLEISIWVFTFRKTWTQANTVVRECNLSQASPKACSVVALILGLWHLDFWVLTECPEYLHTIFISWEHEPLTTKVQKEVLNCSLWL